MKIISRAPCRVDLAGGTLDIWPLYLFHSKAVTINFAIDRYATCTLTSDSSSGLFLRSDDLDTQQCYANLQEFIGARKHKLPLLAHVIRFFAPHLGNHRGISVVTNSEAPAGAGISGSSALIMAVSSALNRLAGLGHSLEKLREISQNLEAQLIRVPTGAQDYYPAMYGGVSAIEMGPGGILRKEIPVDLDEFNERIVVAYTGLPRNSGINNWEVMKKHINGDRLVHRNFDRIAAIANAMRETVEQSDWNEMGRLLRAEWAHRKKNAPGITSPLIDTLVDVTRRAGATGAKACGAGGGGCVFFLAERGAKTNVSACIERHGATVLPVKVAPRGVQVKVD